MARTLFRIQEYYDGQLYQGKLFEENEFSQKWKETLGKGYFDYFEKWNGFNFPGPIFLEWKNKMEEAFAFTKYEISFLEYLESIAREEDKSIKSTYIIAVAGDQGSDTETITLHETAHALHWLFDSYRKKMNSYLKKLPKEYISIAESNLLGRGYRRDKLKDEMQAYLASDDLKYGVIGLATLKWKEKNTGPFSVFSEYFKVFCDSKGIKI